jgi:hypothetical protein
VLEYDEDEGILWITPMLENRVSSNPTKDIVVTIDDCDCSRCIEERGIVGIDRSIHLKLPLTDGKVLLQPLTIEEAGMLGRALMAYSENLDNMIEEE